MGREGWSQHGEELATLEREIVSRRRCPRLVAWREEVAREKRASFENETYWGRPVPGFGDPEASVVVLGLAPAAHGANRTGRVFTGDRSGDFCSHRCTARVLPTSRSQEQGRRAASLGTLDLGRRPVRPASEQTDPGERDACLPTPPANSRRSTRRSSSASAPSPGTPPCACFALRPKPKFAHGAEHEVGGVVLIGCYHPSQQNTFTGVLTSEMLDTVLSRARSWPAVISRSTPEDQRLARIEYGRIVGSQESRLIVPVAWLRVRRSIFAGACSDETRNLRGRTPAGNPEATEEPTPVSSQQDWRRRGKPPLPISPWARVPTHRAFCSGSRATRERPSPASARSGERRTS